VAKNYNKSSHPYRLSTFQRDCPDLLNTRPIESICTARNLLFILLRLPPQGLDGLGEAASGQVQLKEACSRRQRQAPETKPGRGLEDDGEVVGDDSVDPDVSVEREQDAEGEIDGHIQFRRAEDECDGRQNHKNRNCGMVDSGNASGAVSCGSYDILNNRGCAEDRKVY
jgi:hypothetical protein